jgi:hypothetical protein
MKWLLRIQDAGQIKSVGNESVWVRRVATLSRQSSSFVFENCAHFHNIVFNSTRQA